VDGGVEDVSTVSLIQLEEQTVERCIVALDTQKGSDSDSRLLFCLTCRCFLEFSMRVEGVVRRPFVQKW
jgi:hypothetical protein